MYGYCGRLQKEYLEADFLAIDLEKIKRMKGTT